MKNPFGSTIVSDPWSACEIDVHELHPRAYEACREALEFTRSERRSTSVLLHGEAGSGKTHLLGRLRADLVGRDKPEVDPIVPDIVFVSVRLQTGPRRIWRYVRRSFVTDLLRDGPGGVSQLRRVLLRRLAEVRPADADLLLWWEWFQERYPDAAERQVELDVLFERLDAELHLGRDLCLVLGYLLQGRHRLDAQAWLRGDPMPEETLRNLGVGFDPDDDELPEDQAREVVTSICRLAGANIPVVFCFDQVEALQLDRHDDAALWAFGQLVMELFNLTSNVVIISCVLSMFRDRLRACASGPAWDRLAIHQATLAPLLWDDAQRLVAARLDAEDDVARLRRGHAEPLWPLDADELRRRVGKIGLPARRVLAHCFEEFERWLDARFPRGEAKHETLDEFLARTWSERLERARPEPGDADASLSHGLPRLVQLAETDWSLESDGPAIKYIEHVLRGPRGQIAISLCNHGDMRSLRPRVERLLEYAREKRFEKLVLVRDARLEISRAAERTIDILGRLEAENAGLLRISPSALSALDAVRGMIADSQCGELTWRGDSIPTEQVAEWIRAHLPDSLTQLLGSLLANATPNETPTPTA